jgi:hypothetical protein
MAVQSIFYQNKWNKWKTFAYYSNYDFVMIIVGTMCNIHLGIIYRWLHVQQTHLFLAWMTQGFVVDKYRDVNN